MAIVSGPCSGDASIVDEQVDVPGRGDDVFVAGDVQFFSNPAIAGLAAKGCKRSITAVAAALLMGREAATVEAARKANMSTKSINGNRLLNGGSFAPAA
jgi:hypothetical protein